MNFVEKANLPQGMLKKAAVGDYPEVINALHSFGTEAFVLQSNPNILEPVQNHADMTILHLGKNQFFTYDQKAAEYITALGGHCTMPQHQQSSVYPQDIGLNCLILGNKLICNTRYCAKEVLSAAKNAGFIIIDVKQGYSRCSVAVIDENSVITADKAIAQKLSGEGIDVLLIQPGFISLPGFDYGFIGGCCAKLCKDKILFCGNISRHPDGKLIEEFITAKNIEIICTSDNALTDFGGIVQIAE